ncbi:hypothetical protein CAP35_13245 [Chitinophagaceae bacterium IBVUCB1]|nr:hypothetical protein CAP35_13245 [Chitinophagaceae bacterium IBVUCB1]
MKRLLIILFTYCLYGSAMAQPNTDSMLAVLKTAPDDTNKAKLLQEIAGAYFQTNPEQSKAYSLQVLQLSEKLQWDMGILRGNYLTGRCYAIQNDLPQALKYFQHALTIARKIKNANREGIILSGISAVYATNNDYDKALKYGLEAAEVYERAGIKYYQHLMVNIGYLYIRQEKFDDALHYYHKALQQELQYGTPESRGELANIYLNLGGVYIRQGNLVPALENYYKAEGMLSQLGLTKNIAISQADIGECYLRAAQGKNKVPLPDSLRDKNTNLNKAERYLLMAWEAGNKLGLIEIRAEVAGSLTNLYAARGQYQKAFEYQSINVVLRDSLRDIGKEKEFAMVEAQYLVQKQTDSLHYLNALKDKEIKQSKLQRNGGILLIALAGIISLLLINRQKLKHIQRRKIAEAEKQKAEELARMQLDDFTKSIQEKNQLIEKFADEIAKYQALPCSNELPEGDNSLQLLQSSVILNDEQWASFQSLFNKVHNGYISRVKEKYPDLTTAELRTILLTKLGLTNKEMAAMLGVSLEAIRVNKHRLLKKIQLPDDIALEGFVQDI